MKCKEGDNLFTRRVARSAWWMLAILGLLIPSLGPTQTAVVSVVADADSFVWSLTPTSNYGAAGALSVSGPGAVNASGQQNGLFDTLMRFPLSNVVSTLDSTLGRGNWVTIKSQLILTETATPDNAIFDRGVGAFQVFRLASDNWIEGTGRPMAPTTDGVTWSDLAGILNSNLDVSVGVFTNAGLDVQSSFALALTVPLVADIRAGAELDLRLTEASPSVGFTFNSRNFGTTNAQPMLEVTAAIPPKPRIDQIALAGNEVSVTFQTVSNWSFRLQASNRLLSSGAANWTDLLIVPAQSASGKAIFHDGVANQQRFYY